MNKLRELLGTRAPKHPDDHAFDRALKLVQMGIGDELADVVDAARYMSCQDHSAPIKNCCYCKVDKALRALDAKLEAP